MHVNTVKMLMWCNVWGFKLNEVKNHPKISKITQQFWKTPKVSKTPKPRSQNMKCMKNERLDAYQEKKILKNLEETFKDWDLEWDEKVWERKQRAIEREIEWNENRIARGGLNRTFNKSRQMRCRASCWAKCRENACRQLRYWASIEQQGIRSKNRRSIDPPGVKKLSRRQELSRSIQQVSRSCQDCDMKKA